MGCERSRMGDAFRPLSPAPFVVVTEPAVNRERERDLVRHGKKTEAAGIQENHTHASALFFFFQPAATR